jgi:hypothetical protein
MNKIVDVREFCRKDFSKLEVIDLGNNKVKDIPIAFVHYL